MKEKEKERKREKERDELRHIHHRGHGVQCMETWLEESLHDVFV
jgi:hypothetical protein